MSKPLLSAPVVRPGSGDRLILSAILAVSAALRLVLAERGGQWWWPDENRFGVSLDAARAFAHGQFHSAMALLFASADHVGFKVLALLPAFAVNAGLPLWSAAAFFGLFSVGSIYLVWRLAWLTSGDGATALWSAFFAAITTCLFYFSRSLVPYDPALFFGLCCLASGLRGEAWSSALTAGIWAGLCFLTYNGYWLLSGVTLMLAVAGPAAGIKGLARRAATGAVGLLLPVALELALGRIAGTDLIKSSVAFSQTVNLGDFAEGWTFPWAYLFCTEGAILAFWLLALGLALSGVFRRRRTYFFFWAAAVVAVCLGLGVFSAVLHKFVVYGRISRCLAPFFALLCGGGMAELRRLGPRARSVQAVLAGVLLALALPHFAVPLRQWYPDQFSARAKEIAAVQPAGDRLRILNARFFHYPPSADDLPVDRSLFSRPHPMQYEPFLYENQNPEQRRQYRSRDLTMRLVRLRPAVPGRERVSGPGLHGYAGPVRLTLRLPTDDDSKIDPVLETGQLNVADFLCVTRMGPGQFRFNFEHTGAPGSVSATIALDEKAVHRLVVSFGSLLPPLRDSALYDEKPEWRELTGRLFVTIDGRPVFDEARAFFPATPQEVDFGRDLIGNSAPDVIYRGTIIGIDPVPPAEILEQLGPEAVRYKSMPKSTLAGYPGPIRIKLRLPATEGRLGDPLVVTGLEGAGDFLNLAKVGKGRFRFVLDHWNSRGLTSDTISLDESIEHTIDISLGSLMPPDASPVYRQRPALKVLTHRLYVAIDGRTIFDRDQDFYPASTAEIDFGHNLIGGTSTAVAYGGSLLSIEAIPATEILQRLPGREKAPKPESGPGSAAALP